MAQIALKYCKKERLGIFFLVIKCQLFCVQMVLLTACYNVVRVAVPTYQGIVIVIVIVAKMRLA
jgi:hypothetical protein